MHLFDVTIFSMHNNNYFTVSFNIKQLYLLPDFKFDVYGFVMFNLHLILCEDDKIITILAKLQNREGCPTNT